MTHSPREEEEQEGYHKIPAAKPPLQETHQPGLLRKSTAATLKAQHFRMNSHCLCFSSFPSPHKRSLEQSRQPRQCPCQLLLRQQFVIVAALISGT